MNPCIEIGCDEPRAVSAGGRILPRCRPHYNAQGRIYNRATYKRRKEEWLVRKRIANQKSYRLHKETRIRKICEDPEAVFRSKRRRHLKRNTPGFYTKRQWEDRVAYYGFRCYLCGCDWAALPSFDKTVDHVKPLSRGGNNWPANLRPACRKCNSGKNNAIIS